MGSLNVRCCFSLLRKIESDSVAYSKFHTGQNFDACFDFNFPFTPLLAFVALCLWRKGVTVDIEDQQDRGIFRHRLRTVVLWK